MGCTWDHINDALERDTRFDHEYKGLANAQTLGDLKDFFSPRILDTTSRWIEAGSPIEKNDLNIVAWYMFGFISSFIMHTQNESILRHPKEAYIGSIIAKSSSTWDSLLNRNCI